jgi:hypothetical protein
MWAGRGALIRLHGSDRLGTLGPSCDNRMTVRWYSGEVPPEDRFNVELRDAPVPRGMGVALRHPDSTRRRAGNIGVTHGFRLGSATRPV